MKLGRSSLLPVVFGVLACVACSSSDDGAKKPANTGATTPTTVPETQKEVDTSEYGVEKAWAEAHGVVVEPGKVIVVAKRRGLDQRSTVYEDTFVVFRPDNTVVKFTGTTKPAQMPNPEGETVPDVDKDGRKDLGIVRPGVYVAHGNTVYGIEGYKRAAYKVSTEDGDSYLPAWRDLDGDGKFSDAEKTTAVERNYRISGIYIHYGFEDTGTELGKDEFIGPWSVGCLNIKYLELDKFVGAVGGGDATFRLAVVEDK